ncbi:hypothetical protein J6590_095161 [Homalodisca vitripennis]|nr:hypothetical protein J6590_095161 [Homalodisca vitripennis]
MAVIHSVAAMWSHARWMADRVVLPVALGARRETTDTEPHSGRGHRTTGCRSRYERRPAYSDRAVPTLLPSHRELLLLIATTWSLANCAARNHTKRTTQRTMRHDIPCEIIHWQHWGDIIQSFRVVSECDVG